MINNLIPPAVTTDNLGIKVRQLYAFLKEANQLQFRPVGYIIDQSYVVRMSEMRILPSVLE